MSGKRDSDSRPQPWQGCALPTELFPQIKNYFKNLCTRDRHRTGTAISGNGILSPARLPIPPPGLSTINVIYLKKSGKRDSDSRPQPWQGCALPTELFPHYVKELGFLKRGAKIELIFVSTNFCSCFFETFFTKFFNIFIFRY